MTFIEPGRVDALIRELAHVDWMVRAGAAAALARLGDVRAVEPLIAQLSGCGSGNIPKDDASACAAMATALGQLGDARAVKSLVGALGSSWTHLAGASAWALGEIGDTRAVQPLGSSMNRAQDLHLGLAIVEALEKLGDRRAVPALVTALLYSAALSLTLRNRIAQALEHLGGPKAEHAVTAYRARR
jgi:HEAT repeat protein